MKKDLGIHHESIAVTATVMCRLLGQIVQNVSVNDRHVECCINSTIMIDAPVIRLEARWQQNNEPQHVHSKTLTLKDGNMGMVFPQLLADFEQAIVDKLVANGAVDPRTVKMGDWN